MLIGLETDEIRALSNLFIHIMQSKPHVILLTVKIG